MSYTLLLYWEPGTGPEEGTPELEAEYAKWDAVTEEMRQAGVLVLNEALNFRETAVTISGVDGSLKRRDGDALGAPDALFGFYVLNVDNEDEAIRWAERMPHLDYGSVEIRPSM
jgi:hypothetical protein